MNKNMEEEKIETATQETNEEATTPEVVEPEKAEKSIDPQFQALDAQKRQWREKAEKAEIARKTLQAENERLKKVTSGEGVDVSEYIDITAALSGLDTKEQEKLAKEHKLSGRPLSEIRKDEDFILWQSAYRAKVEKEKALNPSTMQAEIDRPKTLEERLAEAKTLEEKGKILSEAGLNPMTVRNY